jgi:hypothetical protein
MQALSSSSSVDEAIALVEEAVAGAVNAAAQVDSLASWLCSQAADLTAADAPSDEIPLFLPFFVHEAVRAADELRGTAGRLTNLAPPADSHAVPALRALRRRESPEDRA